MQVWCAGRRDCVLVSRTQSIVDGVLFTGVRNTESCYVRERTKTRTTGPGTTRVDSGESTVGIRRSNHLLPRRAG